MKYYGVTDDSNELLHYGRLGMKWGKHIFVGQKSLAYKNTLGKLRNTVKNAVASAQKSRAQKREAKFNNAVKKAQDRLAVTERLRGLDQLKGFERQNDRAYRNEAFMAKTEAKKARIAEKNERKYARNERKMNKYMQQAREGTLRYGKLSDEQVDRITQRLAIERSARQLGNTEKASYRQRRREAIREGKLEGYKQGTTAAMREIAIGLVQNKFANKRVLDKQNRHEAQRQKEATRIRNHRTRREIRKDASQEAYEAQIEAGENIIQRSRVLHPFTNAGKRLQKAEVYKNIHAEKIENNTIVGRNLKKLQEKSREEKRLQEGETKRRNDIDARWQQYLDDGNPDFFIDSKGHSKNLRDDSSLAKKSRTELYKEREKLLKASGYSSSDIKDKEAESKRNKDAENKRRDDIDTRWKEYIAKGGKESFIDSSGRIHDYTDDGKKDRAKLYDEREKRLRSIESNLKAGEETANKKTYDDWAAEEKKRIDASRKEEAKSKLEEKYDKAVEKWKEDKAKGKTVPKPSYHDMVETKIKYEPVVMPDYEDYKRRKALGLPMPGDTQKNNNGGGKKGGGGKGKK